MQGTRSQSIEIWQIFPCNRAKPVQIKVGVSYFQWIKRPKDEPYPPSQCLFALKKFQRPPNSLVAIFRKHARHVRMQKYGPISNSDKRQGITDQSLPVERAQNLPTRFLRHNKQSRRLDFEVVFSPNFPLQRNAALKFFHPCAFSDDDPFAHQTFRAPANFAAAPFSARFAVSQNSSIRSRGTSASAVPLFDAKSSIRRNLEENFALAFFSAISGSTCRKRARFTAANSKSPISSSVRPASFAFTASCSSPLSS